MVNEIIKPQAMGMTSLEIAEVTGKQHQHILRDIDGLLQQGVDASNFGLTSYTDSCNRQQRCYHLTPKGCLILASGYDALLREKIINRLEAVETGMAQPLYQTTPQSMLHDKMIAAKWAADFLNLNEVSKLLMAKQILDPLGLPTPDYVPSKGVKHSAKELLARNGIQMSAQSLNKALAKAGILKQHTRPGKGSKVHKWYVITDLGERFGENGICPQSPNQTQPLWYDDMFSELVATAKRATA